MEEGKRFSLLYLQRSAPARDSIRFRNRLAAYYWDHVYKIFDEHCRKIIQKETGAEIPFLMGSGYSIAQFIKKNDLRDVLDSITLIYSVMQSMYYKGDAEAWKKFVSRVFIEENIGYKLDSKCGVHYYIDEEFERNRYATLSVLDGTAYSGVRAAYEDAYRYMDNNPMDTKAAVRSIFESLEILVKQMVETKNLNKWIVENTLKEKSLALYTEDETARKVVSQLFDGFAHWVDGLHNYRHGQVSDEPVAPTEDMAIYVLSSGSSLLRWLIEINDRLHK
jgi:FtsZ-binding cell division protein ZapB